MYIDSDRTLFYDGQNFMYRVDGHPDDELGGATCESISLELWLVEQTDRRDPELLKDQKFYYTTLWHEFIRITKVIMMHTQFTLFIIYHEWFLYRRLDHFSS